MTSTIQSGLPSTLRRVLCFSGWLLAALPGLALAQPTGAPPTMPPGGHMPLPPIRLPTVPLGYNTFTDTRPIKAPLYGLENFTGYYSSNRINDGDGHKLPGRNSVDWWFSVLHFHAFPGWKLLGADYGAWIKMIYVDVNTHVQAGPSNLHEEGKGLTDLWFSPMLLQWTDGKLFGKVPFWQRIDLQMVAPTGEYHRDQLTNPGANAFSFDPYYGFTTFLTKKIDLSMRLHYLWSANNNNPQYAYGPEARTIQNGQAFHMNYAVSYGLTPTLRAGIDGYFLKQTTSDELNGKNIHGGREMTHAIGPGLVWRYQRFYAFLNSYFETHTENRQQGSLVFLRLGYRL